MKELIGEEYFDSEEVAETKVAPEKQDGEPPKNEVAGSDGGSEAPENVSPEVTKKVEGEPPVNEVSQFEPDDIGPDVPDKQEVEPHGGEVREPDVSPDVPDKQEGEPPDMRTLIIVLPWKFLRS